MRVKRSNLVNSESMGYRLRRHFVPLDELNPNILIFGDTPGNSTPAGPTNSANLDRSNEFDPTVLPRFVTAQRGEVVAMTEFS